MGGRPVSPAPGGNPGRSAGLPPSHPGSTPSALGPCGSDSPASALAPRVSLAFVVSALVPRDPRVRQERRVAGTLVPWKHPRPDRRHGCPCAVRSPGLHRVRVRGVRVGHPRVGPRAVRSPGLRRVRPCAARSSCPAETSGRRNPRAVETPAARLPLVSAHGTRLADASASSTAGDHDRGLVSSAARPEHAKFSREGSGVGSSETEATADMVSFSPPRGVRVLARLDWNVANDEHSFTTKAKD